MIVTRPELPDLRNELAGASVALRLGTYDVLHNGHEEGLRYTASMADVLVIGVMPDDYVTRAKGPDRPIRTADERVASVDSSEWVDYSFVVPGSALGVLKAIKALRPTHYVESKEHGVRKRLLKTGALWAMGVQYVIDPRDNTGSSSWMIRQFGPEEAARRSSLQYLCTLGREDQKNVA